MEGQKKTKIIINGKEYQRIEDVPEEFQALIKTQIDAALADPQARQPGAKFTIHKTFKISTDKKAGTLPGSVPEEGMDAGSSSPVPGIQPTSKAWVLWLLAALTIAFYYFKYKR